MPEPTVDLTEAHPAAVRGVAADLRTGDTVYDTFGRPYRLQLVTRHRGGGITTKRADGWVDSFQLTDPITYAPTAPQRR